MVATFRINPWVMLGAMGILGLIYLVIRRNRRIAQQAAAVVRSGEQPDFQAHLNWLLATWANLLIITLANSAAALNLVLIPVVIIPVLFTYEGANTTPTPPPVNTMRDIVEGVFLGHAQALLAAVVYGGVFIGVFTLIMWGIARFNARRVLREIPAPEQPAQQSA
jgi:hypothetical protein